MGQGNDPDPAERWTRERFEGDVLECAGVFRLERPSGWTVTGTAGERYALRPPPGGPAIDVDISVRPLPRVPAGVDVTGYLLLFVSVEQRPVEDLVVTSDASGHRAEGRWHVGEEATSAVVVATTSHYVLASVVGLYGDDDALAAGERVLAALQPL